MILLNIWSLNYRLVDANDHNFDVLCHVTKCSKGDPEYICYRPNGYLSRNRSVWPKSPRPTGSRDEPKHLD